VGDRPGVNWEGVTPQGEKIVVREWEPGDACMNCGSLETYLDDDGIPSCRTCHASDADET
jgi:hypothetical protein